MHKLRSFALTLLCLSPFSGYAGSLYLSEGFDDITQLPANGWSLQNLSEPVGDAAYETFLQGGPPWFDAYDGAATSYIATQRCAGLTEAQRPSFRSMQCSKFRPRFESRP